MKLCQICHGNFTTELNMDLVDLKKIVSFVDNTKINGMNVSFLQFVEIVLAAYS